MPNQSPERFRQSWGIYATAADLPNTAGAATQSSNLTVGDTGYVTATATLWVCTNATRGGAAWSEVPPAAALSTFHTPIVAPGKSTSSPGAGPQPIAYNAAVVLAFTLNTDDAFRQFRIPASYVSTPTIHLHWTKTGNLDESGKVVRWRFSYLVFDGESEDINVAPTVIETEDTYDDNGTTTRIVYRTPDLALVGFVAGYYCAVKIEAVTPVGTPMASEPGLFALDLMYNQFINQ